MINTQYNIANKQTSCYAFAMKIHRISRNYAGLLKDIKTRIREAQYAALRAVNKELIALYWDIGKMIVERQKGNTWGMAIVTRLARDLRACFPAMRGFSNRNLWEMKKFYEAYKGGSKLQPLVAEIPWSHNLIILHHTGALQAREFYLRTCARERWSRRELERQIGASLFERIRRSKVMLVKSGRGSGLNTLEHFKDEYMLDFLSVKDPYSEKELRKAILSKLKDFFLEFGRYFALAGEEYRLNVGGEDYFVDLLFFHRLLKCFVAVELKIGGFKPEYVGKMQFYLTALDETTKLGPENPSVGIILCKSKNDEVVRIAVSKTASPIKVATYKTKLIDRGLLKQKLHSLPSS
jgi:predicted nuclease of restriction endonuclease-like (RecB) superfamily